LAVASQRRRPATCRNRPTFGPRGKLPVLHLFEPRRLPLLEDLAGDSPIHGADNVAEKLWSVDKLIPRSRLRPRYGSGWQSVQFPVVKGIAEHGSSSEE
jgi:hypothetical protein